MRGSACVSRWCSAPSAASACGRTWSRCRRCRRTSASCASIASLPYTMAMIGFAFGGVAMGRLADRYGIVVPAIAGTLLTALGFLGAGLCAEHLGSLRGACGHWLRLFGHLRADRLGHVALVSQAARHRDRDRVMRQLRGGRHLAADHSVFHRRPRLARGAYRHRDFLSRHDGAARADVAPAFAGRACRSQRRRRGAWHARAEAQYLAGAARDRGHQRAASRWQCRRCISSPTAPTLVTARRAAPRCCR